MEINRVAVMGAGALGSYYGAILARSGCDVTFITHNAHLEMMNKTGLQVKSYFGDFSIEHVNATDKPQDIGEVDVILFTVKTYSAIMAAQSMLPMVGKETIVLPLQTANISDIIGAIVGIDHIVGGVTYISCNIEAPGTVNQSSNFRRIVIGEYNGVETERLRALHDLFSFAGVTTTITEDIRKEIWNKFIFIGPICGIGSIARLPIGKYRSIPESRDLLITAMREVQSVALAQGIALDKDIVDQKMKAIDVMDPDSVNSMQRDVMNGRKSELEEFVGRIVRLGDEYSIPTPVHRFIYATLKPRELTIQ